MTAITESSTDVPVRKSVTVSASAERAFRVFTEEMDTWWPRTHHIGKVPMRKQIIEPRAGGRCYSEQIDGTVCPWGTVLVWDPPSRVVLAWQIDGKWQYVPDLAQASEVEMRFTAEPDGLTRVDLEHRHFSRHGDDGAAIRSSVDSSGGWGGLLQLFAAEIDRSR